MKAKVSLSVVVAILFISLLSIGWISREKTASTTKWEYKVEYFNPSAAPPVSLDDWLNKLGAEGWELVQITGMSAPSGSKQGLYYFKRNR